METSLDSIRTFLAVAEARSFTQAAGRLGVSPAAVSKAIRSLEQGHGVTLFQRSTRNVALTEPGRPADAADTGPSGPGYRHARGAGLDRCDAGIDTPR